MWNRRFAYASGGLLFLTGGVVFFFPPSTAQHSVQNCLAQFNYGPQTECLFRAIESEIRQGGVEAAMDVFAEAYRDSKPFVEAGCHRQAHRVGDFVYYGLYVGTEDLDKIDFPQSTAACGYGFYHGFMEHLIQDRPDPEFVTYVCEYFHDRLGSDLNAIRHTCYHGAGHGFMLARVDRVQRVEWGNVMAFTGEPLRLCESLGKAQDNEVEQCREGVFNVLVEFMASEEYGFRYNRTDPFAVCSSVKSVDRYACFYEMAQKLDGLGKFDPVKIADIVADIEDEKLRSLSFRVGVMGIIQNSITDETKYRAAFARCGELSSEYRDPCVGSLVDGLFEHGAPQEEYKRALAMCRDPLAKEIGFASVCFEAVARRLVRFYRTELVSQICREFPADELERCLQISKKRLSTT